MAGVKLLELQNFNQTVLALEEHGYRRVYVEKALGFPFGTLTRWLTLQEPIDPAAVVLFKILRLYPWMIDVADFDYDLEKYRQAMENRQCPQEH